MNLNDKDYIVIGAGGHAQVVAAAALANGARVVAYSAPDDVLGEGALRNLAKTTDHSILTNIDPESVNLLMGIGNVTVCGDDHPRRRILEQFLAHGFCFPPLIHPHAWVAPDVILEAGAQIHAGVIIQPNARIGAHSIINTKASVDHHSHIGSFVHIAPGVTVCGGCTIGTGSMLGSGAQVIHGIHIGDNCLIAAGATVVNDLPHDSRVKGTPATPFKTPQ